ncbi:MAG: NAD(P)-dependent oxidoreductase, partial [Burkholderiaceae bacterium]|nr:NAD(P)-dependent oxidoreductase [Burkholderiaceae bacterium]
GWRTAPRQAPPGWPGRLQWVHTASAGIDYYPSWLFDVPQVTCSRGVAAVPIAEFVLHALLEQAKQLGGRRVGDPTQWQQVFGRAVAEPMGGLQGQTLGLVGYGAIGREVARRAQAFGMQVLAWRRSTAPIEEPGVQTAHSLPELLAAAHHVVLAVPATPETRHLIHAQALAQARPGLHLVNIARGSLVDHEAVLAALDTGQLAAATLDVTEPEPLPPRHRLYTHPRVRLTPHISWSSADTEALTTQKFVDNLARYLRGQALQDRVDPQRGY